MYKKLMLFMMIAVSFSSQAMLNHGLKNIIKKSVVQKTVMRTINFGKEQIAKEEQALLVAGTIRNCLGIGSILVACVVFDRVFPAIDTKSPDFIEYFEGREEARKELKDKNKNERGDIIDGW